MKNSPAEKIETQVLIIGSGAGGAITAATLAEEGFKVLLVEEGSENNFKEATHTPNAMKELYRNKGISPILGKPTIAFVEGCCLGGSTEINSAFWHRTPKGVISKWNEEYKLRDFSKLELYKLFDEIEETLNISFAKKNDIPKNSKLLKNGADKLGWSVVEVPRAQSKDMSSNQYLPGAKNSMSKTYLPKAIKAGAEIISNCKISKLISCKDQVTHAIGVVKKGEDFANIEIKAEFVFLCAGATQTPTLLINSGIKKNVGKSLKIHPMLKVAAEFDEVLDSHKSPLPIYQVDEFSPDFTIGGSVFSPGFLAINFSDNWESNKENMCNWKKMAIYYVTCSSTGKGTVSTFPGSKETIIKYNLTKKDEQNLFLGFSKLCELLFSAGAKKIYPAIKGLPSIKSIEECKSLDVKIEDMSIGNVHAFSSCPMGENKSICAANSYGQVYGFHNLYISDASIIPSAPGVNPQGTVMALALRNAKHFVKEKSFLCPRH